MKADIVKLTFPAKPDYILAIRLAVSGIAERVGFTIEDIEDLKVASAEACILLLAAGAESVDIHITVEGGMDMEFCASGRARSMKKPEDAGELSQYLLEALVDQCTFETQDGRIRSVRIYKKL